MSCFHIVEVISPLYIENIVYSMQLLSKMIYIHTNLTLSLTLTDLLLNSH